MTITSEHIGKRLLIIRTTAAACGAGFIPIKTFRECMVLQLSPRGDAAKFQDAITNEEWWDECDLGGNAETEELK